MKRVFIILSITFACVQKANAQAAEIFASYSSLFATSSETVNGTKISVSDNNYGLSLGYNSLNPCFNDNCYFVIGGKLSYIWDKENNYTENILRLKVPVSLKCKVSIGNGVALEPYAGLNGSMYMVHTLSVDNPYGSGSSSVDLFSEGELNHFTFGGHVGLDLRINNFVIGVCYEKDFTNYSSNYNTKWSSIDFKVGLRFE